MSPETILYETVRLLKIARLSDAPPERIAFLERDVSRLTRLVVAPPPGPIRGEGHLGPARSTTRSARRGL